MGGSSLSAVNVTDIFDFPYQNGRILILRAEGNPPFNGNIHVQVLKLYQPWTLSCVMQVRILRTTSSPIEAVLKLYDRRFAPQLRSDQNIKPWTQAHETSYMNFIRKRAAKFLAMLQNHDDFEDSVDRWDRAQDEAYLYEMCQDLFKAETLVYGKLQHLQGNQIPILLAPVKLCTDRYNPANDLEKEFLKVKGILLELIPGPTLAQLTDAVPRNSWQTVINKAIQIVHELSEHNILNEDVRPSNIIINPIDNKKTRYRVVMIDFAQCRVRGPYESESDWGRAKWNQDEEGAIGLVMQSRLKRNQFDLEYRPSSRFGEWADRESDDEAE